MEEIETIFQGIREFKVSDTVFQTEKEGEGCYSIRELVDDAWVFSGQYQAKNAEVALVKFLEGWRGE